MTSEHKISVRKENYPGLVTTWRMICTCGIDQRSVSGVFARQFAASHMNQYVDSLFEFID